MKMFEKETGVNFGGTDEWYTPREAVELIAKYIKPHSKILCPFDTAKSNFVKIFKAEGHEVTYSHIEDGVDFFLLDKPSVDYVISNPPYSRRQEVLTKLYEWDIPFAMIFNGNGLLDSKTRMELARRGMEILYIYPRVQFIGQNGERNHPSFQSVYWCHNVLPEKLVFEWLDCQERLF